MPIGATRNTSETQLVEIDPRLSSSMSELLNAIAAIPQVSDDVDIETDEDHQTITSPILGFVHMCARLNAMRLTSAAPLLTSNARSSRC